LTRPLRDFPSLSDLEMSGRAFPQQIGNLLRSPMAMMPLWIVAGTALYTLGWSRLFEPFRLDTLAFLAIAALLFVALATTSRMEVDARPGASLDRWALTVIGVYFVGAYIENGGIPVIQIATGDDYDVYGFGVDGLHIFMLCFTGFYGVRAWHVFLTRGGMWNLAALAGIGGLLLSIGNRSAFSFLVFACAVVFVRLRRISAPVWAGVILAAIIFAFGFGKFGDFRLSYQIEQATGEPGAPDAVLALARATDGFRESGLSPSWLWTYMYFASPLANLNSAFNLSGGRPCGQECDVSAALVYDVLPDVIGVRLGAILGIADPATTDFLVAPNLTASTAFGTAVVAAGAVGGMMTLAFLAALGVMSARLLRDSPAGEVGMAILATVIFFCFFENMLVYTPLLGQLAFPLALAGYSRVRRRTRAQPPESALHPK